MMLTQNEQTFHNRFQKKHIFMCASIFILAGSAIAAWLYAATIFEKSIKTIQETLVRSGTATFSNVCIHKYALKATFADPIFTGDTPDVRVQFKAGDCLNVHYNFLTKTITLRIKGDEALSLKADGITAPLIHSPKYDNHNDCRYKIILTRYFPDFTSHEQANLTPDQHIANLLKNIIGQIKSIQLKGKNGLIHLNTPWNSVLSKTSFGSIRYNQFNCTLFPSLQKTEANTFDLHIRNQFSYTNFTFVSADNTASPPSTLAHVKGKSTSIIHFGSDETILRTIRQFHETGDWWVALTAFSTESQSHGKRTYEGQKHTYNLSTSYDPASKFIRLTFDGNDIFDATWKRDYVPALRSVAESYQQTFGSQKTITEAMLTNILPALENHNPVKSTITVHIDFKNDHVLTNITAGYVSERHGATIALSLSAQKAALLSIQKLFDMNNQTLETVIDKPININITLHNQAVLIDDIQGIITRALEITENNDWIKSIPSGRAIIDKSIQLIAEQSKPQEKPLPANETQLCFVYDIKTNAFTYGRNHKREQQGHGQGHGLDQLITHIMPDVLQTVDLTHDNHHGHTHGNYETSAQSDTHDDHKASTLTDGMNDAIEDDVESDTDDNEQQDDIMDESLFDDEEYARKYANTIAGDLSPNGMKKTNNHKAKA